MDYKTRFNKVVVVILIFLLIAIYGIYANQVTITAERFTSSDTLLFNGNFSFYNDSYFNARNKILNSKGHLYNITFTNLQLAIYDLNSTSGGWVQVPQCNITFTTTLLVTNGTWLRGSGNGTVFYLGNGVNKTMISNYHVAYVSGGIYVANGQDKKIHLSDFVLDGNQYRQPRWLSSTNRWRMIKGVMFTQTNYSSIDHVVFKDTHNNALHWACSNFIDINNCWFYNIGKNWSGYTAAANDEPFETYGIRVDSCENISISKCMNYYCYNGLLAIERASLTGTTNQDSNHFIVSDCISNNGYCGLRLENANTGTVSNFFVYNTSNEETYAGAWHKPAAFLLGAGTHHTKLIGCSAVKSGNSVGINGTGIYLGGHNNSVIDCSIDGTLGNGSYLTGLNNKIFDCIIKNSSYYGIYVYISSGLPNFIINHNDIYNTVKSGIYTNGAVSSMRGNKYGSISENIIYNATSPSGSGFSSPFGILNRFNNITINDNSICNYVRGIYLTASHCMINDNQISSTSSNGIYIDGGTSTGKNNTIVGNKLESNTGLAINLVSTSNNTVVGNNVTFYGTATGTIIETTAGKNNLIATNNVNDGIYGDGTPKWDVNSDGTCAIFDLVLISNHYGQCGSNGWIREDADNNGEIQVLDLVYLSNHYGELWWM